MKKLIPYFLCLFGIVGVVLLVPRFNAAQPHGLRLTRAQARAIADREARRAGVPVDKAWSVLTWEGSPYLDKEFESRPDLRRRAESDPVVGPRLGGYRVHYFRIGLEKVPSYARVLVGENGEILGIHRYARAEEAGANPTAELLRPKADAIVKSRTFPGAPGPVFESVRPTILRGRTDHIFIYRVPSRFPTGPVVFALWIYFTGDEYAGWEAIEEYVDGSRFRFDIGGGVIGTFIRFGMLFILLLILLIIFLRKYHAGEVGVETGAFLFATVMALSLLIDYCIGPHSAIQTQIGGIDARMTTWATAGFKLLFFDIPSAVLVFLAWSVGESYARERWGDKLASFDSIVRRDPLNATAGRSVLRGLLLSPAVTVAALVPPLGIMLAGRVHPTLGTQSELTLSAVGGPLSVVLLALQDALIIPTVSLLFILALFHRRRLLPWGIVIAVALGALSQAVEAPVGPFLRQLLVGFGGLAACVAVFLAFDLLTASIALFSASLLIGFLPLLSAISGPAATAPLLALGIPLGGLLLFALAALATRREVVYEYEDLAPHVKRIIERERVKAEIDAANRIQSALLPARDPQLEGAAVASHYRAASEIGGDYYDFLPLPDGRMGIAFGDVAGHGLTSGIIMAMAKSALLVQVGYDSSPARVLTVLNEIVMKTAPKRMLMTFFFGVLDPRSQELRFSSAGHLDPYVFRADSGQIESLSSWGFPLGVRRRDPFRELTVRFAPGDRLILYSDGLIEALDDDGEPFGFTRFEQLIQKVGERSAEEIKGAVLGAVKKFTRNRPPVDDQTLVVVSFETPRDAMVLEEIA